MFVSLDIYDEKFVLKLYLRKILSYPTGIEPMSPNCWYGCREKDRETERQRGIWLFQINVIEYSIPGLVERNTNVN